MQHIGIVIGKIVDKLEKKQKMNIFFIHKNGFAIPLTLKLKLEKKKLRMYREVIEILVILKKTKDFII